MLVPPFGFLLILYRVYIRIQYGNVFDNTCILWYIVDGENADFRMERGEEKWINMLRKK